MTASTKEVYACQHMNLAWSAALLVDPVIPWFMRAIALLVPSSVGPLLKQGRATIGCCPLLHTEVRINKEVSMPFINRKEQPRFVVVVKGKGFPVNPSEEYHFEGHARKSFREWVDQGKKTNTVEYIQLWDLQGEPSVLKERRWA